VRVVLLVTDLERGGTPLRVARTAIALRAAGIDAVVGCLARRGPVGDELETAGVPTFACDARGPRDLAVLIRLANHLRRLRPALVHASLFHANIAARLVGRRLKLPILTSTATIERERRWHLVLERLTARWDRGHVVNSGTLRTHVVRVLRVPAARVFVIPPALARSPRCDPERRAATRAGLAVAPHEFVVLWVGRFDPVKRLEIVVRTAEALGGIPARTLLVGDGPLRAHVEQLVRTGSAANRTHLLGWRRDVADLYAAADALLFPSLTEGMPNAVLEALAAGLPIVASDIPAIRELIGAGAGIIPIDSDRPTDFAAALDRLYRDAAFRAGLAQRSRGWAQRQPDIATVAAELIRVYQRVLER
jgi:glycosyltransferase involved in cell wall biosynthesis